jgi:hypothetical protein
VAQGTFGRIEAKADFTGLPHTHVPAAEGDVLGNGWALIGVNEGSYVGTVDEPGGILAITTDTADNDNHAIWAGTFKPADGGMVMEARVKMADMAATQGAVFVGFTETLAKDTPVMPAETATATTTYNGTGGIAGFVFDSDSTALVWRFVVGDAGAALATETAAGAAGTAVGITPTQSTATNDRWYLLRVEVTPDGIARGYFGDIAAAATLDYVGKSTAALGTGDSFHACVLIENRAAGAEVLEIDYAYAEGGRDWLAS